MYWQSKLECLPHARSLPLVLTRVGTDTQAYYSRTSMTREKKVFKTTQPPDIGRIDIFDSDVGRPGRYCTVHLN
jgi:hypothetical protein